MGGHVYNSFWISFVPILYINFNKATQKFTQVHQWQRLLIFSLFIINLVLFVEIIYDISTKVELIFAEAMFMVNAPFSFMTIIYYFQCNINNSRYIISISESLQILDDLLKIQMFFNKTKNKWIGHVTCAVNMLFFGYVMTIVFFICAWFYNSNIKMQVGYLFGLLVPMCFTVHSIVFAYLLMDRSKILNAIIINLGNEKIQTMCCYKCTNLGNNKNLCKYHQMQLVCYIYLKICRYIIFFFRCINSIYTIIFNICYTLERSNNLMLFPVTIAIILHSPSIIITLINAIILKNQSKQILILAANCVLATLSAAVAYFGAVGYHMLTEEVRINN